MGSMRKQGATIALALLVAACTASHSTRSAATRPSPSQPAATAGRAPCDGLPPHINEHGIFTAGAARPWGPQPRGGSSRYAGYAASDKLAVCLQSSGDAVGI